MSNVAICLLVCGANFVLIYKMHDSRDVCLLQLYGRVKCSHEENFRISMECCVVVCAKIVNRYYAPLKKANHTYVLATIEQYSKQQIFLWADFWVPDKKKITILLITTLRGLVLQYYYLLLRELFAIFRDKKFHFNFNLTLPRCYILQMFYNIGKVFAGDLYIYGSSKHGNPEIVELLFKRSEDIIVLSQQLRHCII